MIPPAYRVVLAVVLTPVLCAPASFAHPPTDLEAEIASLDAIIDAAGKNPHAEGSPLWVLEEAVRQTLALAKAGLLARRAGASPLERESPIPDPERAAELLRTIVDTEREIRRAEREAAAVSGMAQSIALLTAATGRLTAAQLRLAWYEARFGLVLALPPVDRTSTGPHTLGKTPPEPESPPEWADPAHPEIDYSQKPFQTWRRNADRFSGWWAIREGASPIDDSREVYATNLYAAWLLSDHKLVARCREHRLELYFSPDTYMLPEDAGEKTFRVIVRYDSDPARIERWNASTTNRAVFHARPLQALQMLAYADKVFVRVHERSAQHDTTFLLAGAEIALSNVAAACGHTLKTRVEFEAEQEVAAERRRRSLRTKTVLKAVHELGVNSRDPAAPAKTIAVHQDGSTPLPGRLGDRFSC